MTLAMPRKRTVTVYSFEELSDEAKERALREFRDVAWDYVDSEHLTDMFKEDLRGWGFENPQVCWSLDYSKGDGVAFSADVNVQKYLLSRVKTDEFKDLIDVVSAYVKQEGRYCHYNSMSVNVDLEGNYEDLLPEDVSRAISAYYRDVAAVRREYEREVDRVHRERMRPIREWEARQRQPKSKKGWVPGGKPRPAERDIPFPEPPVAREMPPELADAEARAKEAFQRLENLADAFRGHLDEDVKDISRKLEKMGYAEIEYQTSDEYIADFFVANEFEFRKDGSRYR